MRKNKYTIALAGISVWGPNDTRRREIYLWRKTKIRRTNASEVVALIGITGNTTDKKKKTVHSQSFSHSKWLDNAELEKEPMGAYASKTGLKSYETWHKVFKTVPLISQSFRFTKKMSNVNDGSWWVTALPDLTGHFKLGETASEDWVTLSYFPGH